ncbi:MAG: hypothetical protein C4547_08520 [Phycisphaerales bacterium]|nr:MAG: hypothetical protein C4547_08520 [Phycisphaerales bacterium]
MGESGAFPVTRKAKNTKPDPDPAVAAAQARVDETARRLAEALAKRAEASCEAKEAASIAVDRLQLEHTEAVDQLGELKAQRAAAKGQKTKEKKHHRRQAAAHHDHAAGERSPERPPRPQASGVGDAARSRPPSAARDIDREWDALDEADRCLNEQERQARERHEREQYALEAAAAAQRREEADALRREAQLRAAKRKEQQEAEARRLAEQRRQEAEARKAAALARHEQAEREKQHRRHAVDAAGSPSARRSWGDTARAWCRDLWRWITFRGEEEDRERAARK